MTKIEMTEAIMAAKSTKGLTWGEISEAVGLSEIFLSSACLGQNSLLLELSLIHISEPTRPY